ncbi:MAG: PVC-type heme-binding CxxCH protein [Cyclobacteriaceae bacterium]
MINISKSLKMRGYRVFFFCVLLLVSYGCQTDDRIGSSNVSPENALRTFQVAPGFQIELVASEPLIEDPVAMEIDVYGHLYVVEMRGNPFNKSGTGKIKLLTDSNGDGMMDKSTVFADSLIMPSGLTSWKRGVLVTDPPHVLYLEDSNGDGRADIREVLLTGFDSTDLESNVNNPVYGLDNWIYLGNGPGSGEGDIYYSGKPEGPRIPDNASGHMIRFRPEGNQLEMTSGQTQFGHSFDNWGHHFLVNNSNHIYQEVIAARYLNRNRDLLVSEATQSLSDHGESAEVYPITKSPEHQLLTDVGVFTSACSVTPYQGGLFPPLFDSVTFVAEPVSNLVHADVIKNKGSTFTASRLYNNQEFLASTDAWFRPVNMYIGPEGALYIVDYYRQIIEGPEWMAEEVVKSGNLYNGSDKGRIYRITPKGTKPPNFQKNSTLTDATLSLLVEKLGDPNIWWRRNAQRLLVDRNDQAIVPDLVMMATNSGSPIGRVHALWTLEGMHQLKVELIRKALQDPNAGVRENAIKLAEPHLKASSSLVDGLLALKNDPASKVRYQLLCTLGFIETRAAARVRESLLFLDVNDPWVQVAALSATSSQKDELLSAIFQRYTPVYTSLVQRLAAMVAANDKPEDFFMLVRRATAPVADEKNLWQVSVLEGLSEGLKHRKIPLPSLKNIQQSLVKSFMESTVPEVRLACLHILQQTGIPQDSQTKVALMKAEHMASDLAISSEQRAGAIEFLGLTNPDQYTSLLKNLIVPREPLPIQLAALKTLSKIPDTTVSRYVLQQWDVLTPEIRDAALNTFLVYPFNVPRLRILLEAIENGRVQENNLGWSRSVTLMRDIPDSLKSRARFLLTKDDNQRQALIKQYEAVIDLKGDEVHGREIFRKNCSLCHQMGGVEGKPFGPDLSTVRNWLPSNLILNILDPAVSIANGYDLWAVELNSGEVKQGIILSQTPSAITLRYPGGLEAVIARNDVKSLKALDTSAMPPGLEKQINQQQMADLLTFLKNTD